MKIIATMNERRAERSVERSIEFEPASSTGKTSIGYSFAGSVVPPPLERFDAVAVALIFHAMRCRSDLHVAGPVSARLLENLEEFQRAWAKWRPDLYTPVQVTAEVEVEAVASNSRDAVLTYSGGVDANFSLVRHASGAAGRQGRTLKAAVLVHGFDIPLDKPEMFTVARLNAEEILGPFGVPLCQVVTDWRQVGTKWESEFGTGLVSCLCQFNGVASIGLIGSDEDYGSLVLPWGSNPVTNPFLSSEDFTVTTDGTGYSRCEKVALIATFPNVTDRLRVCWEHPTAEAGKGGNCGQCEKCLRTKMNFLANRSSPGRSLSDGVTNSQIRGLRLRNEVQLAYLDDILRSADLHEVNDDWVKALQVAVFRNRITLGLRRARRWVGQAVRRSR